MQADEQANSAPNTRKQMKWDTRRWEGETRCENQWWDFKWKVEQRRRKTKAQRGWHSHQYYPIFRNNGSETHRDKGRQMNRIETKGAKAPERRTRPPILGNKLSETQADKRGATTNKINEQRRRETKTHTGWHSHQYSRMKWDAGRQKKTEAHQQPDREADSATNTRRQMNETEGDTGRQEAEAFRWTETKGDKDLERHKCCEANEGRHWEQDRKNTTANTKRTPLGCIEKPK